jgi:hypothetical protein
MCLRVSAFCLYKIRYKHHVSPQKIALSILHVLPSGLCSLSVQTTLQNPPSLQREKQTQKQKQMAIEADVPSRPFLLYLRTLLPSLPIKDPTK